MRMLGYLKLFSVLTSLLLLICTQAMAQKTSIVWERSFGGSFDDLATSGVKGHGNVYLITGTSSSYDGDVSGNTNRGDYWVIKLDTVGSILRAICFGGRGMDLAEQIITTYDEGYVVMGKSSSNDGDVSGNHGDSLHFDIWIIRLDSSLNILWEKCIGGSDNEKPGRIIQTRDSGFMVIGTTYSIDHDAIYNHGRNDVFISKLNSDGIVEWSKCYGGSSSDYGSDIVENINGGFTFIGYTTSNDKEVSGNHTDSNFADVWVGAINDSGQLRWQKCFGGSYDDYGARIIQISDNGFLALANTYSDDGDVNQKRLSSDYWLLKLDSLGTLEWEKCYGGNFVDAARDIKIAPDSGFYMLGTTRSWDGDVTGYHTDLPPGQGGPDLWLLKIRKTGELQWQKCLGGTGSEFAGEIVSDGKKILLMGSTNVADGDVSYVHYDSLFGYNYDYWVVKVETVDTFTAMPEILSTRNSTVSVFPNPGTHHITVIAEEDISSYAILDFSGVKVMNGSIDSHRKLDINNLSQGLYYISLWGHNYKALGGTKFIRY